MPITVRPFVELPQVLLLEAKRFQDDRGWFEETYKDSEMRRAGILHAFVQDNQAYSKRRGTLRGLHFQNEPAAQGKVVRCVRGEIFDVAIDIRRGSPTYGRWVSARLSAENRLQIWIPPGFAHGLQTLQDDTEVAYKVTSEYSPSHDRGIRWNDPTIGVAWPLPEPILSPKDAVAPLLSGSDHNFTWQA